jgi:hypothetical protein
VFCNERQMLEGTSLDQFDLAQPPAVVENGSSGLYRRRTVHQPLPSMVWIQLSPTIPHYMSDVLVYTAGSLIGFAPASDVAQKWFRKHYPQRDGIVWCDHAQAENLAMLLAAHGFAMQPVEVEVTDDA